MVDAWWPLIAAPIPVTLEGQAIHVKRRRDEEQRQARPREELRRGLHLRAHLHLQADAQEGGRLSKMIMSKLYTYAACARQRPSSVDDEVSRIGGPGFSRVVHTNDPAAAAAAAASGYYCSNKISTTKYSAVTFLPKSLFEQFRHVANIYFLITALLSYSPIAPFRGSTAVAPLVLVLVATMVKEAIEDCRRKQQDVEVNNRKAKVFQDGSFYETKWTKLRVGDVVKVEKDNFFPADLILLSSSYEDAIECCQEPGVVLEMIFWTSC